MHETGRFFFGTRVSGVLTAKFYQSVNRTLCYVQNISLRTPAVPDTYPLCVSSRLFKPEHHYDNKNSYYHPGRAKIHGRRYRYEYGIIANMADRIL
jgi:hypothetical protein